MWCSCDNSQGNGNKENKKATAEAAAVVVWRYMLGKHVICESHTGCKLCGGMKH